MTIGLLGQSSVLNPEALKEIDAICTPAIGHNVPPQVYAKMCAKLPADNVLVEKRPDIGGVSEIWNDASGLTALSAVIAPNGDIRTVERSATPNQVHALQRRIENALTKG